MQNSAFIQDVLNLTNQFRANNGLTVLTLDFKLAKSAQQYSQDMALSDFFGHTGKDRSTAQSRALSAGYESGVVGENIAAGYATPKEVVDGWINSSGHRANLLNPSYNEIGIGYYYLQNDAGSVNYNSYWTQSFGKGVVERPAVTSAAAFDPLQYGASYSDLIQAFGTDTAALSNHYNTYGKFEGRQPDLFSEADYLASYDDLINAFGYNPEAATRHYIQFGYREGRAKDNFNEAQYLASNPDLIKAFGYNPQAATQHYISYGAAEERSLTSFDPAAYLNKYTDLRAAFGSSLEAATRHYIEYGCNEGRTW